MTDWRLSDAEFLSQFCLPSERPNTLAVRNPLSRDSRITFSEQEHIYTFDGVQASRSVTSFLHQFSDAFNAREAIEAMQRGQDWAQKQKDYLRDDGQVMSVDEIANLWERNGACQRARGQLLHYHAELFLNNQCIEEPHSPEFKQFMSIYNVLCSHGWKIFRTELAIFHIGLDIAGSVDLLCRDPDGNMIIVDWKRNKRIKFDNRFRPMMPPLEHVPDCNWYIYCLQLNLYAYIIETEYDFTVTRMLLGVVHPVRYRAQILDVPRLSSEIQSIINWI
jgi:ATP-dependent exoDNAse (exonuclease V) beta subunit